MLIRDGLKGIPDAVGNVWWMDVSTMFRDLLRNTFEVAARQFRSPSRTPDVKWTGGG